jgi:hypothetical protein
MKKIRNTLYREFVVTEERSNEPVQACRTSRGRVIVTNLLLAAGSGYAMVACSDRLLTTQVINNWETCAALKVIQRDVRANEAILVVVRRLVVPNFLAA